MGRIALDESTRTSCAIIWMVCTIVTSERPWHLSRRSTLALAGVTRRLAGYVLALSSSNR